MALRTLFAPDQVALSIDATTPDGVLDALVALLGLDEATRARVRHALGEREAIGSTGIGHGIAVPHCRIPEIAKLQVGYGRARTAIEFQAIDGIPVRHFFLIVAPPGDPAYLTSLAGVAQLCKRAEVIARLDAIGSPAEFLALLEGEESGAGSTR